MISRLHKPELLDRILGAIESSGWQALILDRSHPFLLRLFKGEQQRLLNLRVYVWNCTPGGKNRPEDEYRVQITGVVPKLGSGETTLLLGWHEGYGVFVGFDIRKHHGQASSSPSIQVKESSLINAHNHAFSTYDRANGEIAICFRPEFIADYALNLAELHGFVEQDSEEVRLLNIVDEIDEKEIETKVISYERREVIANIKRKYREHDFRHRVLNAYAGTCAFCGIQLKLVEAAHILPVAVDTSTDETTNGIALCALHHCAYDQGLMSFNEDYLIEISGAAIADLRQLNRIGGLASFQKNLKSAIILPADKRDYPAKEYIRESRRLRQWRS